MRAREKLLEMQNHRAGLQGLRFSSSDSESSSSTTTIDQRSTTDSGTALTSSGSSKINNAKSDAVAINATGGSKLELQMSDLGAVERAFGFAREVAKDAFEMSAASQVNVSRSVTDAISGIEAAYSEARVGDGKALAVGALAVVGVVAFVAMRGK